MRTRSQLIPKGSPSCGQLLSEVQTHHVSSSSGAAAHHCAWRRQEASVAYLRLAHRRYGSRRSRRGRSLRRVDGAVRQPGWRRRDVPPQAMAGCSPHGSLARRMLHFKVISTTSSAAMLLREARRFCGGSRRPTEIRLNLRCSAHSGARASSSLPPHTMSLEGMAGRSQR